MLFDLCNCLTILLVTLITFAGFIVPGCKGNNSGKETKKTSSNVSQKKVSTKSKKSKKSTSSRRKGKTASKKQEKSKKDSKREVSKTQTENNNSTVTKGKEEEAGDKIITKAPSKGPEAPAGGSIKEQDFVKMELYNEANDTSKVDTTLTDIKPSTDEVLFENGKKSSTLTLHNVSDVRRAFKLKCSDVNICKVKPSVGYLAPNEKKNIEFSLVGEINEPTKFVVLYTIGNLDGNDAGKEFKADEKYTTINLKVASL
uniref:Major sperm protein n=1 Tax=Strongyloides papillosus TaxID=174720 RepID=A0A0N5BXZ0_STREA